MKLRFSNIVPIASRSTSTWSQSIHDHPIEVGGNSEEKKKTLNSIRSSSLHSTFKNCLTAAPRLSNCGTKWLSEFVVLWLRFLYFKRKMPKQFSNESTMTILTRCTRHSSWSWLLALLHYFLLLLRFVFFIQTWPMLDDFGRIQNFMNAHWLETNRDLSDTGRLMSNKRSATSERREREQRRRYVFLGWPKVKHYENQIESRTCARGQQRSVPHYPSVVLSIDWIGRSSDEKARHEKHETNLHKHWNYYFFSSFFILFICVTVCRCFDFFIS